MDSQIDLNTLLQKGYITDELELERAFILENKLRLLAKNQPEYIESRKKIRQIIKEYEQNNWSKNTVIDEEKIKESDLAEIIAQEERIFLLARKNLIKKKIAEFGYNQQDLGVVLGHTKSYMSELMNGISPFQMKDLIIIHKLFHISLKNLIPVTLPQAERTRITTSLQEIKPKIKNKKKELILVF